MRKLRQHKVNVQNLLLNPQIQWKNQIPFIPKRTSYSKSHFLKYLHPIFTHLTTQPPQSSTERIKQCLVCTKGHLTTECPMLKTLTDPGKEFRNKKICIYCGLHKFVYKDPCRKRKFISCGTCQGSHATELHKIHQQQESSSVHTFKKEIPTTNPSDTAAFLSNNHSEQAASSVILPTAVIQIMDSNENWVSLRCLVDQCCQISYITEDVVQQLRLKKKAQIKDI